MPLPLLLLLGVQQVEPPRTVNGIVLGSAEEYSTPGPARICLGQTGIDIERGETAYLDYLGIHWGSVRVVGPKGDYLVREGSFLMPSRPGGNFVPDWRGRTVERFRKEGRPHYLIYARWNAYDEEPAVSVEGNALGRSRDSEILNRITIFRDEPTKCQRRFEYGGDMLLPNKDEQ